MATLSDFRAEEGEVYSQNLDKRIRGGRVSGGYTAGRGKECIDLFLPEGGVSPGLFTREREASEKLSFHLMPGQFLAALGKKTFPAARLLPIPNLRRPAKDPLLPARCRAS